MISALPSYGRGRELPGPRYGSLIHGQYLEDFVITGACLSAEEPFLLIPQSSDFICVFFFAILHSKDRMHANSELVILNYIQ